MTAQTAPMMLSGLAHARCGANNLSTTAPTGKMKLSEVASQIQYLVVAVPRGMEVRTQAASQTIEA